MRSRVYAILTVVTELKTAEIHKQSTRNNW